MQPYDTRARRRILGLLFLGVLMAALDIAIIGPALPALRSAFGIDDRAAAWVLTIYVLFGLIGTPLMARLSDVWGRRAIYILDVALFATGSLGVALSRRFGLLLAGRAIQGLGSAGILPVASAVIGDIFPVEKRGGALGLIGAVFGVAFIVGPILGGVLLLFGWPLLFLVNLPIAAIVIVGAWRLLPATRPSTTSRAIDVPGLALLSLLLFALAFGLNRLDAANLADSLFSPAVWPFLSTAAVLAPLFWLRERAAGDPIVRPALFRSRQVVLASGLALGAGLTEASIVFVPALLVAAFGVTASKASFMLLPVVLALAVASPVSGRLLDRYGSRWVVVGGTAMIGVGMVLVAEVAHTVLAFYAAGTILGVGLAALVGSALRYIMLNEAAPSERAAAQGVLKIFTSTGQLLGAALVGALVASGAGMAGYDLAFLVVGATMLMLALGAVGLKGRSEELRTVHGLAETAASTA